MLPERGVIASCDRQKVFPRMNQAGTINVCTICALDTVSMCQKTKTKSSGRRSRKTPGQGNSIALTGVEGVLCGSGSGGWWRTDCPHTPFALRNTISQQPFVSFFVVLALVYECCLCNPLIIWFPSFDTHHANNNTLTHTTSNTTHNATTHTTSHHTHAHALAFL